jgi:hypothetical protein
MDNLGVDLHKPEPDITLGSVLPSPTAPELELVAHDSLPPPVPSVSLIQENASDPMPLLDATSFVDEHIHAPSTPLVPLASTSQLAPTSSPELTIANVEVQGQDHLAASLRQFDGEAAFLPSSAAETRRSASGGLYSGQGSNPQLRRGVEGHGVPEEEEAELYIPGLMSTSLFVLLPMVRLQSRWFRHGNANVPIFEQTDSLTPIIDKYLPPNQRPQRDLTGAHRGRTLEQLIVGSAPTPWPGPLFLADLVSRSQLSRSWRAVAEYCHDAIMESSADQTSFLLAVCPVLSLAARFATG